VSVSARIKRIATLTAFIVDYLVGRV
jgi:hypothetical protein